MFIGFFERLRGDAPVRVFLILGNLCAHLSRILKAWLREHAEFTELFYLSTYRFESIPTSASLPILWRR